MKSKDVLAHEGEADFVLVEGNPSVWITVGNISVYISRNDEGVAVDLYPLHHEYKDSLASAWATFAEADDTETV